MKTYQVKNIFEAIELAEQLKEEGKYNWFRGQIQNWNVVSSFIRLDETSQQKSIKEIKYFNHWLSQQSEAQYITKNRDYVIAVGQHYGLKTSYIDFTTDPKIAGFFATQGKASSDSMSSIICLNTYDFEDFIKIHHEAEPNFHPPELLELDIPNLWRMQAQKGVFMYSPYENIELLYNFDRILFPCLPYAKVTDIDSIYPKERSQLEILLEQFFEKLKAQYNSEKITKGMNKILFDGDTLVSSFRSEYFNKEVQEDSTWDLKTIEKWKKSIIENHSSVLFQAKIQIDINTIIGEEYNYSNLSNFFIDCLVNIPSLRNKVKCWDLIFGDDNRHIVLDLKNKFDMLWEGIRYLPYSDIDISISLSNMLMFVHKILKDSNKYKTHEEQFWLDVLPNKFGESIVVEYQNFDKSYSRSCVSKESLRVAFRDNYIDFLNDKSSEVKFILLSLNNPRLLFNFNRFTQLFVREVLPVQVLWRSEKFVYNPTSIEHFGIP